jgi:hypothetical protein
MMRRFLKTNIGLILMALTLLVTLQLNPMIPPVMAAEESSADTPQVRLGPEVEIKSDSKSDKDKKGWFARNKWWVALGAILAGGTAAALAAGGSSDDNGGGNGDGTFSMDW